MSVIAGIKRTAKQLVDGTIAVTIHIEPNDAAEFWRQFPSVDTPCALAPLVNDFDQPKPDKPKGGALCILAARWCKDEHFRTWLGRDTEEDAAEHIRKICNVSSRSWLDRDEKAGALFNDNIRIPYMNVLKADDERTT